MTLAIFDLDNTLLAGDSDHAWGEFLVEEGIVDAEEYRLANDRFYQEYLNGELDILHYLGFALQPLASHNMEELLAWREAFMEKKVRPMMQATANSVMFLVRISTVFFERTNPASSMANPAAIHMTSAPQTRK